MADINKKKKAFYDKYYQIVSDSLEGTGLFPEMVINQMGIESNWGTSKLTTKYNNFFGIKKGGSNSSSVNMSSDEEIDGKKVSKKSDFRTYDSIEDSIKDYVNVLKTQGGGKTYAKVFEAKTPLEQAKAIGDSPYATGKNYGESIVATMKASEKENIIPKSISDDKKNRYNYGLKDHTGKDILLKNKYASKEEKQMLDIELAKITATHGEMSKEAKLFRKNRYEKAYMPEIRDRYKKKIAASQEKFDNATSPEEVVEAKKELDYYGKVYERTNTKDPSVRSHFNQLWKDGGSADVAMNYNEWTNSFSVPLKDIEKPEHLKEKLDPKETKVQPTSSDVPVQAETSTRAISKIDDVDFETGEKITYDEAGKPIVNLKDKMEADAKAVEDFNAVESEQFNFEYAPDSQSDRDVVGSLMDVGRGVLGMMGATKEIPIYERGTMFQTAMGEAEKRRNMGLTTDEINFRRGMAETGYHYDIKNIRRGAGGSAGAYLGNIGRAQTQLYGQYGQIAATDEATRRLNRQNFQGMAVKDETINRQIFQDELSQTMMTKEAGAGLVQDAIKNMKERSDYRKQYGKDSPYYQYMKSKTEDAESTAFYRDKAEQDRVSKSKRDLEYQAEKSRNAYEGSDNLNTDKKDIFQVPQEESEEQVIGSNTGNALVNSVTEDNKFIPSEPAKKGEPKTGGRYSSIAKKVDNKLTKKESEANIAATVKKQKPAKLKKEFDILEDAKKYGGLTPTQEQRRLDLKKELKKLK